MTQPRPDSLMFTPSTKNPLLTHNMFIMMSFSDRGIIKTIIEKLGGFTISTVVDKDTTHVVCGDGRRTLNVLRGISQGCWIVSKSWV